MLEEMKRQEEKKMEGKKAMEAANCGRQPAKHEIGRASCRERVS